jgi:hypothetical protein
MAWTNNSAAIQTPENPATVTGAPMPTDWLPFDARLHTPMVKPAPMPTMIEDVPIVDERQREREREEVKACLQGILRNRLLSETARVSAARELTRIFDNEELQEMREEVKRLTAIIEANAPDESDLPPHLQRKRR